MICVENLSMHLGRFVLNRIGFSVPEGAYAVLMGPTGCGKTSVIEAVCGLRPVTGGRIIVGGHDVTVERPGNRGIGYVPQDGALFSTMSVRQHLNFPLRLRRWKPDAVNERVEKLARQLDIEPLLDRGTHGLSGGERQRVALGRALSFFPKVLLLDEPLSALDEDTQSRMVQLLQELHRSTGITVLHVTHKRQEAEQLGTIHLQLENGILQPKD